MNATKLITVILAAGVMTATAYTQSALDPTGGTSYVTPQLELVDGSRLWIEGTTTVNDFDCEAASMRLSNVDGRGSDLTAQLDVAVDQLDCGKSRMNRDLQHALQSETYPSIRYKLVNASINGPAGSSGQSVSAMGLLTVAGVERAVETSASAMQLDDSTYRVSGSLPIRMTDYNVTPPRALRGLIRVRDEIVVQFDLTISSLNTQQKTAN